MSPHAQIAQKIIEAQELIIGPVALSQAESVEGITLDWGNNHGVSVDTAHPAEKIDELVQQYADLFGPIAVETCKGSAARYLSQLPPDQVPKLLS